MQSDHKLQNIQELIDRLARLNAAEEWNGPLNPSQNAALSYLARANPYSRAPSHVADFLMTTRGTASQTLKALARKGLISEARADHDKRSIRYDVTIEGNNFLDNPLGLSSAISKLEPRAVDELKTGLEALVRNALKERGGRTFGICRTCRHHKIIGASGHCDLLNVALSEAEVAQICHEHEPVKENEE